MPTGSHSVSIFLSARARNMALTHHVLEGRADLGVGRLPLDENVFDWRPASWSAPLNRAPCTTTLCFGKRADISARWHGKPLMCWSSARRRNPNLASNETTRVLEVLIEIRAGCQCRVNFPQ
ncbi:hypothetical protein EHI46_29455 [Rhizobium leguminosarum]|nr:hypothetical protein EHI46_29455 [Rhizobium leguminosarum]